MATGDGALPASAAALKAHALNTSAAVRSVQANGQRPDAYAERMLPAVNGLAVLTSRQWP